MQASVNIHEGEPVARIAPLERDREKVAGFGSMRDEIKLPSDEEWKELDEEIEQLVEGSQILPSTTGIRSIAS